MRKSLWLLWPYAVLLIVEAQGLLSQTLWAQEIQHERSVQYSSVHGIVTDSLGRPIEDALVEINGRFPTFMIMRYTSKTGKFSADSLLAGETYTVSATRLGYHVTESAPFVATSGSTKEIPLTLKLRRTVVKSETLRARTTKTTKVGRAPSDLRAQAD